MRQHWTLAVGPLLLGLALALAPINAEAGPAEDLMNAYIEAADQLNNLELEKALETLDAAVTSAEASGEVTHPALGTVHAMRAGIIYAQTQDAEQTRLACVAAANIDYNFSLPIELRSEDLQKICDAARSSVERPTGSMLHQPPRGTPDADLKFTALANVALPVGSQIALYWRSVGSSGEFAAVQMTGEGNWGAGLVEAAEHNGKDVEYFIYAFDPNNAQLANIGDKSNPLRVKMETTAAVVAATGDTDKDSEPDKDPKKGNTKRRPDAATTLPRVFINLGFGTGVGLARGTAELTYAQYTPGAGSNALYGPRELACAIERWRAVGAPLAADQTEFLSTLRGIQGQSEGASILPIDPSDPGALEAFARFYDADYCSRRHPVSTGLALAAFHIEPEVGIRIGERFVLSVFSRLQVVTGSRVFVEDPTKSLNDSFTQDVRSPSPKGVRQKPDFTWAIGLKGKYFFGRNDAKLRVFAGGFAGYGRARLRVPMGFSNDRNGNSVPDFGETALHGPVDANNNVIPEGCEVVWPYNNGCVPLGGGDAPTEGDAELLLTEQVRASTPRDDVRVDTVAIGPIFAGALLGVHYQVVEHFGVFAEIDLGVWFPSTTSVLADLTLGPVITF